MKMNAFLGAASMLLLLLYLLVFNMDTERVGDLASMLPESTLLYIEVENGTKLLDAFSESRIGEIIPEILSNVEGGESGLTRNQEELLTSILGGYDKARKSPYLDFLFTETSAIALLTPQRIDTSDDIAAFFENNLIFLVTPAFPADLVSFLAKKRGKNDRRAVFNIQYGNHRIHRYQVEERKRLSWVTYKGVLLASFNEAQLRRTLDCADKEIATLENLDSYQRVRGEMNDSDLFFYSPLENVRLFLVSVLEQKRKGIEQLIVKNIQRTRGFESIGYGVWSERTVVHDEMIITYSRKDVTDLVGAHLDTVPSIPTLFKFTSSNPVAWYWSNSLQLDDFLPYLESPGSDSFRGAFAQKVNQIVQKMDKVGLTDKIGHEVTMIVERGDNSRLVPVPLVVAVFPLQTNGRADMKNIMKSITSDYNIAMIRRKYGDARYMFWSEAPQDGMRFFYGFYKGAFFTGNSPYLFRKIVDFMEKGKDVFALKDMGFLNPGIARRNNSVVYIENDWAIDTLKQGLKIFSTIVAIKDRNLSHRIRQVFDRVLFPLLESFKMYKKTVSRSYFTKDQVIIRSSTLIDPEPVSQ